MINFFEELLRYNFQSNDTMIGVLEQNQEVIDKQILSTSSHIFWAQTIWNDRMRGKSLSKDVWEILELKNMAKMNTMLFQDTLLIVKERELSEEISYKNLKGEEFKNCIQEILIHIINHSTYHRGQVMMAVRDKGGKAASTDYIYWKRKPQI